MFKPLPRYKQPLSLSLFDVVRKDNDYNYCYDVFDYHHHLVYLERAAQMYPEDFAVEVATISQEEELLLMFNICP